MKFQKLAPGSYIAKTGPGEYDRYLVTNTPGVGWMLTYPGQLFPDDVYETKREAVQDAIWNSGGA